MFPLHSISVNNSQRFSKIMINNKHFSLSQTVIMRHCMKNSDMNVKELFERQQPVIVRTQPTILPIS